MSQEIRCPNCGAVSAPSEVFCGECGTRLPAAPPPVPSYAPPPPTGGASGLVIFLRGSGLIVGLVLLLVALLLCSCGGLIAINPEMMATSDTTAEDLAMYPTVAMIICCLPGVLFAVIGVLIALFPFTFGRGK